MPQMQMHLLAGVADAIWDYVFEHPLGGISVALVGGYLTVSIANYIFTGRQMAQDLRVIKESMVTQEGLENALLTWENKFDCKYVTREQIEAMMVEKPNGHSKRRAAAAGGE